MTRSDVLRTLVAAVAAITVAAALVAAVVIVVSQPAGRSFTSAELADWRTRHCDQPYYATYSECRGWH